MRIFFTTVGIHVRWGEFEVENLPPTGEFEVDWSMGVCENLLVMDWPATGKEML